MAPKKKPRRRPIFTLILAGTLCVITGSIALINLSTRTFGKSDTALLSPFHLRNKLRALFALGRHVTFRTTDPLPPSEVRSLLLQLAKAHAVSTTFALAVAEVESNYIWHRISPAGAMGVMQLMPDTAKELQVTDPFDARQNIEGGVRYLKYLFRRYRGKKHRVAAAYNAGPGVVPRKGAFSVPSETRSYVQKVLKAEARIIRKKTRHKSLVYQVRLAGASACTFFSKRDGKGNDNKIHLHVRYGYPYRCP